MRACMQSCQSMLCPGFSINTCFARGSNWPRMRSNRIWRALTLLGAVLVSFAEPCAKAATETNFKGTYNGLIYADGEPAPEQSGYFVIKVTASGHFTGKVLVGSRHGSFHGKFDAQGEATANVRLPRVHTDVNCIFCDYPTVSKTNWILTWTLSLQLVNDREQMTGQVFHRGGERWIAVLAGDRAGFDRTNPAPQAGRYTFILPGNADSGTTNSPNGHGNGTLTVDTSGRVVVNGVLADGAIISQSAVLSKDGIWPLFVPLHNGRGMLLAWMTFTNLPDTDLAGTVMWIKPARPRAQLYPAGFTNAMIVSASRYAQTDPVLELTNGIVVLQGGRLSSPFTNSVTLEARGGVGTPSNDSVTLTISPKSGLFKGKVHEPASGQTIPFRGAVLQKQNAGFGYFLGARRSGEVFLGSGP